MWGWRRPTSSLFRGRGFERKREVEWVKQWHWATSWLDHRGFGTQCLLHSLQRLTEATAGSSACVATLLCLLQHALQASAVQQPSRALACVVDDGRVHARAVGVV